MAGPREERPYRLDETDRSARAGTLENTKSYDFEVYYFGILRGSSQGLQPRASAMPFGATHFAK